MKTNVNDETHSIISYGSKTYRASINQSWNRCLGYGLSNQDKPYSSAVSPEGMTRLLDDYQDVLEVSNKYIKTLFSTIGKKDAIIGISSKDGVILHIEGNNTKLEELGYLIGHIHLESHMGTNAIGTSIATGKPIIIWGEEHFLEDLRGWVGFGAPIYIFQDSPDAFLFAVIPIKNACRAHMPVLMMGADSIGRQLRFINDKEQLMDIQERMQDARNSILEMASVITHEVRNSLTNISAYIQLLQLDKSINSFRGDKILKEIARINRLLDDFRLLSRQQRENIHDHLLNEILLSVVDVMRAKAQLRNIELIFSPYKDEIYIRADRNGLYHVFINLLENGIQAMENGGILKVEVGVDHGTNNAIISFKDTGIGIPPDEIDRIFRIFYTTKKDGSGLGLHICKTIVGFHGGDITVESVQGEGTTFFVKLPIINA